MSEQITVANAGGEAGGGIIMSPVREYSMLNCPGSHVVQRQRQRQQQQQHHHHHYQQEQEQDVKNKNKNKNNDDRKTWEGCT